MGNMIDEHRQARQMIDDPITLIESTALVAVEKEAGRMLEHNNMEQLKNAEEMRKIDAARKKLAKYKVVERKEEKGEPKESMKDQLIKVQ